MTKQKTTTRRVKKFKVILESRLTDPELKMHLRYDVPITQLGVLLDWLEMQKKRMPHKKPVVRGKV